MSKCALKINKVSTITGEKAYTKMANSLQLTITLV